MKDLNEQIVKLINAFGKDNVDTYCFEIGIATRLTCRDFKAPYDDTIIPTMKKHKLMYYHLNMFNDTITPITQSDVDNIRETLRNKIAGKIRYRHFYLGSIIEIIRTAKYNNNHTTDDLSNEQIINLINELSYEWKKWNNRKNIEYQLKRYKHYLKVMEYTKTR